MIKVIFIPNSFDPKKNRQIKKFKYKSKILAEYIPKIEGVSVLLNQQVIEDFNIIVPDNSEIVIVCKPRISAIATTFMTWMSASFVTGAVSGYIAVGLSYIAAGAVVMAGSRLLGSLLTPQVPNNENQGITQSQTYSWSNAITRPNVGSPIPILYGTMQLPGNIIQRKIEYVGDDEYLYLQLALCMGEIEDIQATDILINNNPITNYSDIEFLYRNGTNVQSVMPYFNEIESPNDFTIVFADLNPIVKQISGNTAQALRIFMQFPQGIYYQNDKGGLDSRTIEFKVEYKLLTDTIWTVLNANWSISGAQTSPINREIRVDNLTSGQYEVRITRLTTISTDAREMTTADWTGIAAIVYDKLYYPNVAILGIRAKATGQLSGSVNVLTKVTRKPIEVFNESGISQGLKASTNPAWAYWDALINSTYGGGRNHNQIDFNECYEFALWCDALVDNGLNGTEKRALFNGVFDFEGNLWDALTSIATVGRGSPIIKGTKYSIVYDGVSPMVGLCTTGNMLEGTKLSYVGDEELANEVEIQFINKDKNFQNDTFSVVVPEWFSTSNQSKKTTIQQMGITNLSQAYRVGRYYLNNNKNVRRSIEFSMGLDFLPYAPGDVIGVTWGEGGRVVSATATTITLDKQVTLITNQTYTITIRLNNGTFENANFTPTASITTDTLTVTLVNRPLLYDIYTIVESPRTIKLYRIISITRGSDDIRKVIATEYNESVVSDAVTIIPSQSAASIRYYPSVFNIVISEHLEKRNDGTIIPFIDLSWDTVLSSFASSQYAVFISVDNGATYQKRDDNIVGNNHSSIALDLTENKQYYFKVLGKTIGIDYPPLSSANNITYTYVGKSAPPQDVVNFKATIVKNNVILSWDATTDVDLAGYQITINGIVYNEGLSGTSFSFTPVANSYIFKIKAIDTSNILSLNYNTTTIDILPADVTKFYAEVIDNNVLLRWDAVEGSLPVATYNIYKGNTFNTSILIGAKNGTFTTIFERDGGVFTYWIQAVDVAGIKSVEKSLTTSVSAPADYVLNADWYSNFSGTKTNVLHYKDTLVLPVNTTETWQEHFINNSYNTPQDQINAGNPYYVQPTPLTGQYEETFDYGTILSASQTTVQLTLLNITGVTTYTIDISISPDNTNWITYTNVTNIYATNFRYIKVTLNFTSSNGIEIVQSLNIKLDSKLINDAGSTSTILGGADFNHISLLDYSTWKLGDTDAVGFYINGLVSENLIATSTNPAGQATTVWQCIPSGDGNADGGFTTYHYPADTTKNYLYTCFVKTMSNSGYTYIGCSGGTTNNIDGTVNSNPYFWNGDLPTNNDWYLMVGVLNKATATASTNLGGVYSLAGTKVISGTDYKLKTEATTQYHRVYLYYDSVDSGIVIQEIYQPTIIEIDDIATIPAQITEILKAATGYGRTVLFNKPFVDIQAINLTAQGTTPLTAIYDFKDVPNPTGFNIYLFDNNGARTSGNVSWSSKGF